MNNYPESFHLQWHLTERCNLRCSHCYMDKQLIREEMDFDSVKNILYQYFGLLKEWGLAGERSRISFTGGEPFMRDDLFDILEECLKNRELSQYGLLTNGLFLSDKNIARIRSLKVNYVQVSIDGTEKANDLIRGKGTFKKAAEAVKKLVEAGIDTVISMTVHKKNLKDVPAMIALARELKVKGIGVRRLVPWGKGKDMKEFMLSPTQTKDFFDFVLRIRKTYPDLHLSLGCEDGIATQNMRYFPEGCVCGQSSVTVLPNGKVYPCRRLPITVGDLRKERFKEMFCDSTPLEKLRDLQQTAAKECFTCPFFNECLGGARCVSYAYWGKLGKPDPQCWRLFEKLPGKR